MNQNDKRVTKTKKALHRALVELLAEKDLSRITVKEVTERAELHRVTFYAHYQDIYALYQEVKEAVLSEIAGFVSADPTHDYSEYYTSIVEYTYANQWLCQILFQDISLLEQVLDILKESYLQIWLFEDHLDNISKDMRYMTAYNIEGCMAIIRAWWRNGFADPKETITGYLRRANRIFDAVSLIK